MKAQTTRETSFSQSSGLLDSELHYEKSSRDVSNADKGTFPFTNTRVDYFGPIEVKFLRRTLKRWCCLFPCLTTRAEHIEVAQSLDTESCLASVTIFIARRGYPSTIISDNGTNLAGAVKELKAFPDKWEKAKIESDLAQKKKVWKLNPPGAPLWWNLVKTGSKLQEGHECNLGQPKPHRRGTQHNNVSRRANSQRNGPDSSK